jgi:hypothetical protein
VRIEHPDCVIDLDKLESLEMVACPVRVTIARLQGALLRAIRRQSGSIIERYAEPIHSVVKKYADVMWLMIMERNR